jgi:hypothetical protein
MAQCEAQGSVFLPCQEGGFLSDGAKTLLQGLKPLPGDACCIRKGIVELTVAAVVAGTAPRHSVLAFVAGMQ